METHGTTLPVTFAEGQTSIRNRDKPNEFPNIRTLVVEDDASWQQILSEILADAGLIVDLANNLEEALRIIKSEPHRLAIVDLSLAGGDHHNFDGLRILEAVRRLIRAARPSC